MPVVRAGLASHLAGWADHPGERGPYNDMGVFASHLVSLLDRGETAEFPAVFEAVETLYQLGDPGISYLLTVGFLEDLGNVAANTHGWAFAGRFRAWLGPCPLEWWEMSGPS